MGSLFGGVTVTGYNSNPPPDDGSTGSNNVITWGTTIKAKIGDPLNTFCSSISSALVTSFGKTLSGGSVVSTAINYSAGPADQGRIIVVTVSGKTVTTPDATSVLSPFVFAINNQSTGNATIQGFSSQNVDGNNTLTLKAGRGVILWTDGSNWFTSGVGMGNLPLANPPFGFDMPINLGLQATVASNLLTVTVTANDGTTPTASNPVLIPFRSITGNNGVPAWVAVTSALSISTNAVGATLGTANSVPFRIWVCAFNNSGTAVLALFQSVNGGASPTSISAINESTFQSTTGISAAATSAGAFYTPNGTSLSPGSFRILGYLDYQSGLTTAGTYSSLPNVVQLFGPGIKKPGDVLQSVFASQTSTSSTGSTSYVASSVTISITPTSPINLIPVNAYGSITNATAGDSSFTRLSRGNSNNTNMFGNDSGANVNGTNGAISFANFGLDNPGTTSSTTYCIQIKCNAGTAAFSSGVNLTMQAQEIQV